MEILMVSLINFIYSGGGFDVSIPDLVLISAKENNWKIKNDPSE